MVNVSFANAILFYYYSSIMQLEIGVSGSFIIQDCLSCLSLLCISVQSLRLLCNLCKEVNREDNGRARLRRECGEGQLKIKVF